MATVTFQVIEGVDRGRMFRNLPTPVTIGREEGNVLRLNDERVSRFHAKIQHDNGDIILTDLESTNGTRVNGHMVQIRRLRVGDRVNVGRSVLVFGSGKEIAERIGTGPAVEDSSDLPADATIQAHTLAAQLNEEPEFDVHPKSEVTVADGNLFIGTRPLPPMPQKLTPGQAARLAEIFDFLHRGLTSATANIQADEEATQIVLTFSDWQKIQAVHMLLARYLRAVAEPDLLSD